MVCRYGTSRHGAGLGSRTKLEEKRREAVCRTGRNRTRDGVGLECRLGQVRSGVIGIVSWFESSSYSAPMPLGQLVPAPASCHRAGQT